MRRTNRPCSKCGLRNTRSTTGLCHQCKPTPGVHIDEGRVHIDGIGHLTPEKALRLAHAIADALDQKQPSQEQESDMNSNNSGRVEYDDTIKGTAEEIRLGFNVAPDGHVSLALWAKCTPPVGPLRINISPAQAADLLRALRGVNTLTDAQCDELATAITTAATKEN